MAQRIGWAMNGELFQQLTRCWPNLTDLFSVRLGHKWRVFSVTYLILPNLFSFFISAVIDRGVMSARTQAHAHTPAYNPRIGKRGKRLVKVAYLIEFTLFLLTNRGWAKALLSGQKPLSY